MSDEIEPLFHSGLRCQRCGRAEATRLVRRPDTEGWARPLCEVCAEAESGN
jgi:hypothetical protein